MAIEPAGPVVYLGGRFTAIESTPRHHLAAVTTATGTVTDWNPGGISWAYSIAAAEDVVVVGSELDQSEETANSFVNVVDRVRGRSVGGPAVRFGTINALQLIEKRVYIGGDYRLLDEVPARGFGMLDLETGTMTAIAPGHLQGVRTIQLTADALYLGGVDGVVILMRP